MKETWDGAVGGEAHGPLTLPKLQPNTPATTQCISSGLHLLPESRQEATQPLRNSRAKASLPTCS